MVEDELRECPKCEKPTLHRGGKCRQCATIKEIGRLRAARRFDPIRLIAVGVILAAFGACLYGMTQR